MNAPDQIKFTATDETLLMNSPSLPTMLGLLLNPGRIIFGGWEFALAWFFTRRWVAILLILLPLGWLLFVVASATVGNYRSQESMLLQYWTLIEQEQSRQTNGNASPAPQGTTDTTAATAATEGGDADGPSTASATADSDENLSALVGSAAISPYLETLLLRVLEVDTSNVRATYLVARHLGSQGRQGQARWMMRRIASENINGFAPAHAWLAQSMLTSPILGDPAERAQLVRDLEAAAAWQGTSPILISVLADLLASENRVAEAIRLLEQWSAQEPRLLLQVASISSRMKRTENFDRAAARIRGLIQPRLDNGTATSLDYVDLARLNGLSQDFDAAIRLASQALQMDPTDPATRRVLSDAYLGKFEMVTQSNDKIDLLDAALKADGTNVKVTDQLARLITTGQSAPPRLVQALEEKLARGQASALTHLLIANRDLADDKFTEAVAHLEIAYKMASTNPIIMNNLALAITRQQPGNAEVLKRAETLVSRALQISGANAELLDSLGEIRSTSGNHIGAIECFEAAIGLEGSRSSTRQRLATCYRAIGLNDMANIQERLIAEQAQRDAAAESQHVPTPIVNDKP